MPSINDRIGSQNVIRVLSNASAPPTRIVNLTDVDATLKTRDGMLLVWNLSDETFYMTDTIDSSTLIASGIATFSNTVNFTKTTDSTSSTNGSVIYSGGVGIAKNLNVGGDSRITGIVTFGTGAIVIDGTNKVITVGSGVTISESGGLSLTGISTFLNTTNNTLGNENTGSVQLDGGMGIAKNLTVKQNLHVGGFSEFIGVATFRGGTINLGDGNTDDINVGGEFVSDLNPSDDASYDLGIIGKRWRDARFSGLVTSTDLFAAGVSTFSGAADFNSDVDIDGRTELDTTNISETLNVVGISTFGSDIDINASIDVDGLSELDELNVSGIATFASDLDINASVDISNDLNVAGVSTFGSDLDINASVDISNNLNVTGIATFSSDINIDASIDIDGLTELDELNVSGLSTFASNVDINASVDISDDLVVNGTLQSVGVTTLASSGGITTTGGSLFVNNNLTVGQNLKVDGTSEFIGVATFRGGTINLGDGNTDDINVGGEFVSDLNPSDDASYDLGIIGKRWRDARFSGLVTSTSLFVSGISTFEGNQFTTGNVSITGFATVTDGLFYETGDFDGPNGIAYFDDTGKLIGAASTESGISTSNYVLTTNASGIPVWTDTIDGGEF